MKVLTPEIAWHETLPIYSCDLQPLPSTAVSPGAVNRLPFQELPVGVSAAANKNVGACRGTKANSSPSQTESAVKEEELNEEDDVSSSWTRLATAGGDNMIRLWRVNLDWTPPSNVTVTASKKPPQKGMLQGCESHVRKTSTSTTGGSGTKVSVALSEGLVFLATLKRHERLVNVVRWSPSGNFLASAGDDQFVIIWQLQKETEDKPSPSPLPANNTETELKSIECWIPFRSLRRHLEDIYDLCWSPDEVSLISGSVDQSIILWSLDLSPENTSGATKAVVLRDHKHYVQGVAWDPLGVFVVSMSSDRTCRIYKTATSQCIATLSKADKHHLFQDDSWKSFFRRPAFSPDGHLLICPAGNLETADFAGDMASAVASASTTTVAAAASNKNASIASKVDAVNSSVAISSTVAPQHAAHIFLRYQLSNRRATPCVSLPTGPRPVIGVRFCPQPFQLRLSNPKPGVAYFSLFQLPYRWLFCLILDDGLLFFDTQQAYPFAQVSQIHYQALNDVAWSSDGRLVTVTSTDGYCSLVHFSIDELGKPYRGPLGVGAVTIPPTSSPVAPPTEPTFSSETAKSPSSKSRTIEDANAVVVVDDKRCQTLTSIDCDDPKATPLARRVEALKSEGRHISFQSGIETPDRPRVSIPVTPNTGRFLSEPIKLSPAASTPMAGPLAKESGTKRRIPFITLSEDSGSFPPASSSTFSGRPPPASSSRTDK